MPYTFDPAFEAFWRSQETHSCCCFPHALRMRQSCPFVLETTDPHPTVHGRVDNIAFYKHSQCHKYELYIPISFYNSESNRCYKLNYFEHFSAMMIFLAARLLLAAPSWQHVVFHIKFILTQDYFSFHFVLSEVLLQRRLCTDDTYKNENNNYQLQETC